MNFRCTRVWAHLPSLHHSNWKILFRTQRYQTERQGRFRSKWMMVRRSSIQIIAVQYWTLFSIHPTTNSHKNVSMRLVRCWMPCSFDNLKLTESQVWSIHFLACLEPSFWYTWVGQYCSLWGDGFGIKICQKCQWQMKCVLPRLLPQWQCIWYANYWLRRLLWGCQCQFGGGIAMKSMWVWCRTSIPGLCVQNTSGNHCRDWIQCLAGI